jgi:hypothetical protein
MHALPLQQLRDCFVSRESRLLRTRLAPMQEAFVLLLPARLLPVLENLLSYKDEWQRAF